EIEQQRAFAGAGLADQINVPGAFVRCQHDRAPCIMGADTDRLFGSVHSRNGAGVPCAPQVGLARAASLSRKNAPGLVGVALLCVAETTAEPPAHNRLASGHHPCRMWPSLHCSAARKPPHLAEPGRVSSVGNRDWHSPWWDMNDIPRGA